MYMHELGVAHCDMKPANLLLEKEFEPTGNNVVKAVEFGFATTFTRPDDNFAPAVRIPGGTWCFMSSEALESKLLDTTKLDMYSLGIILCLLLRDKRPFTVAREE